METTTGTIIGDILLGLVLGVAGAGVWFGMVALIISLPDGRHSFFRRLSNIGQIMQEETKQGERERES